MGKKGPTKRDLQAEKTRQKILETAVEMIRTHGFDNITVDDICKQSKAAKGSFYHYFKSKDDIIIEMYRDYDNSYMSTFSELPPTMTSIEKLLFTYKNMGMRAKARGAEYVRQIYKSQIYTGTKYFISEERPLFKVIHETIADGQKNNEIRRDLTTKELTRLILIFSRGVVYDWSLHEGDYDIEEAIEKYFRIILTGIAAPKDQ